MKVLARRAAPTPEKRSWQEKEKSPSRLRLFLLPKGTAPPTSLHEEGGTLVFTRSEIMRMTMREGGGQERSRETENLSSSDRSRL